MSSDTLHLVVTRKWYDMIESGDKKEEYREIKGFWMKRLCEEMTAQFVPIELNSPSDFNCTYKPYKYVCFHRGYTNETMTFILDGITTNYGRPEWGATLGRVYFVLKLGYRVVHSLIWHVEPRGNKEWEPPWVTITL